MIFLLVACLLFGNFLALFGVLVAAPAGEWTLKNHENSLVFVGESVCAPFSAPLQKTKKRYQHQTKAEPKKQRKTNTRATHQNIKKRIKKSSNNHPKWLPGEGFGGSGSLLAAGSAPRASQNRLRRPLGPKKNFGRGRGRPKTISQPFLAPLKTDTPPRRGGPAVLRTS